MGGRKNDNSCPKLDLADFTLTELGCGRNFGGAGHKLWLRRINMHPWHRVPCKSELCEASPAHIFRRHTSDFGTCSAPCSTFCTPKS